MGLLASLAEASFRLSAATPDPLHQSWYVKDPSGFLLPGGFHASPDSAQRLSAVWQGVRLRAEGIASVPCHVFIRRPDGGKDRPARGSPLSRLQYKLRWQPNDWQTAFEFWEMAEAHALLRGWFIAEIVPDPRGFLSQLIPRHPDRVTAKMLPAGRPVYEVRHELTMAPRILTQEEVFVVRGRTTDGTTPMSFVEFGAQSLAGALAAQRMTSTFFKRGTPSIAVISKDELGEGGIDNLHKSVMAYVNDSDGVFGVLPLEGDLTIEKLGLTPADSQMLEMSRASVEDIARWLNIPLHMMRINQVGTNSYASLEVFSTEFVTYGLRPEAIRIEQAIQRDLILAQDQETVFAEFLLDALLRGNLDQRAKFYQSAILTGYMNRNEVREKENLNPVDGLDRFLEPQNMAQIDDRGDRRPTEARVLQTAMGRMRDAFRASMLANDLATQILRREKAEAERLAKKHATDPDGWRAGLQAFYEDHARYVARAVRIPAEQARAYAASQGDRLVARGLAALESVDQEAEQLAIWALEGFDA